MRYEEEQRAAALYLQGHTIPEVAAALNKSYGTIRHFLEKSGIPRRPQGPRYIPTIEERFLSSIEPDCVTGCWHWGASLDPCGYGALWAVDRSVKAHRYSWTYFRGTEPGNLNVLHRCDVPGCVNPDHLFLGTQAENVADMMAKGRNRYSCRQGKLNTAAKLTEEQVLAIRAAAAEGTLLYELAAQYGVARATISRIVSGQAWRTLQATNRSMVSRAA